MFKYVITGSGMIAMPVHSDLNLFEFKELIESQSKKLHPKGEDKVWVYGAKEFVNPRVFCGEDYLNFCVALIGIK